MRILDVVDGFESASEPTSEGIPAANVAFTPASGIAATDVQAAIVEAKTDSAASLADHEADTTNIHGIADTSVLVTTTTLNLHINDTTDAHAATAITNTPSGNLAGATVQAALNELQGDIDSLSSSTGFKPNLIDNPEGEFMQRLTVGSATAVADDAYGPDRWNILCSTANVLVSRISASVPTGTSYAIDLSKNTNAGYFGMVQFKESSDSIPLRNTSVTFTLEAKTASLEVSDIKIAIIQWEGTADAVTSDVISAWASSPTYVANITELANATLSLTNSFQQVSVTATVGSGCNNLAFLIFTTNSEASGDTVIVSKMRAHNSATDLGYVRRSSKDELDICQRYYEKSYNVDIAPGTSTGVGAAKFLAGSAAASDYRTFYFCNSKRTTPTTISSYSTTGAAAKLRNESGGADVNAAVVYSGQHNATLESTSTLTAGSIYSFHWIADSEL